MNSYLGTKQRRLRPLDQAIPKTCEERVMFVSLIIIILSVLGFESFIVAPSLYGCDSWEYVLFWFLAIFICFNLFGNILLVLLVDTTVHKEELTEALPCSEEFTGWSSCGICEIMAPPRSRHCKSCGICILKRDHHCIFLGCCIGYFNLRYFYNFILYMFVGCFAALIYNTIYMWRFNMFLVSPDSKKDDEAFVVNFMYTLNCCILCIPLGFLMAMIPSVCCGREIRREREKSLYDLGLKRNIEIVFGRRMFLTCLMPFLQSDLPHDGIRWQIMKETKVV